LMDVLIPIAIFLLVFFGLVTVIGHGIWLALAWLFRLIFNQTPQAPTQFESLKLERCANCNALLHPQAAACSSCGWRKTSPAVTELLRELGEARRQLQRIYKQGSLSESSYREMMRALELERERLTSPTGYVKPTPTPWTQTAPPPRPGPATPTPAAEEAAPPVAVPPTSFTEPTPVEAMLQTASPEVASRATAPPRWTEEEEPRQRRPPEPPPVIRKPRKPLTEVLAAFMEQSNIRWGEIMGGLLIIGCSTALVISLWAEISRIPVLKFFLFTTVTAMLFGVGFYTEHRWKLPTTSRGILTVATLLVPLNLLAIAAVSKGVVAVGPLVVASELIAPALFLCLVYFAGRILTPAWPQVLACGVLGSSIGQLLIRHFAYEGMEHWRLLSLGLFPLLCYVAATGWMLRRAAREEEFDEGRANTIFVTLGASTFATLLSLGLLSYKSGQTRLTLTQLAPLLTLGSSPLLVCGLLLWQRVKSRELNASRTAGTSIALVGALLALASIQLSFPSPASVVPAAFLAFALFTGVAQFFREPRAHLLAAFCFALAFIVTVLAWAGQVEWQSPLHTALVPDLLSARGDQAMAVVFVLFIAASEWLRRRGQEAVGGYYLLAASVIGGVCLLAAVPGLQRLGDPFFAAPIFLILSAGAFFIAWRRQLAIVSWIGSGVLLLALGQTFETLLRIRFPWQAALLAHAGLTAVAAIFLWRRGKAVRRVLAKPLNASALIVSCGVIFAMFESYRWEPTALYAQRMLWLAAVWLVLLWLNRLQLLFTAMQGALVLTVLLAVKLAMQNSEWYAYLPNAWLHPWSLQIQGSVLVIYGLAWIALRLFVRRAAAQKVESDAVESPSPDATENERLADVAWSYLNYAGLALDRVLVWGVLCGFVLLGIYGALNGLRQELATRGSRVMVWNLAGFPHEHAYGAGAWILLGLLLLAMLACFWERRRFVYLRGALLAFSVAVTLLAARWETSVATASAWRWLAALFLLLLSLPFWVRGRLAAQLRMFGLPEMEQTGGDAVGSTRTLLLLLTILPALALTIYPAVKAITYRPVYGPASGLFHQLGDVVSYSLPLVIISLALIGHAVREREAGYAFAAGMLVNLAVTAAQLLTVASVGGEMNRVVLVEVMQLNAIASACFALLWLATRGWWMRDPTREQSALAAGYLKIQLGFALLLNGLIYVPLVWHIWLRPTRAGLATFEAGSVRGWLALVLTFVAVFWFARAFERKLRAWLVFAASASASALIAFDAVRWRPGLWVGFHTLLVASAATAWLMLLAAKLPASLREREEARIAGGAEQGSTGLLARGWRRDAIIYASLAGAWTVWLALRASLDDPMSPWWSVGALVVMSALAAGLNWETLSRAYLYAAGALVNLAATIWFFTTWSVYESGLGYLTGFLDVNAIALALPGIIWLCLELRARRSDALRKDSIPSFHHLAALLSLGIMLYLFAVSVVLGVLGPITSPRLWSQWLAVFSVVALMCACLWDRHARYAVAGLYLLGLVALGRALGRFDLNPDRMAWTLMLVFAAYALLTSLIWKSRAGLIAYAERLGIPPRTEQPDPALGWLGTFNATLAFAVVLIGFRSVLHLATWPERLACALAVVAQFATFVILAEGERRGLWQRVALLLLAVGAVYFGWAWLVPGLSGTWLNRAVVLMIVMFGMIALYGLGTEQERLRETGWTQAARRFIPWFAGTGAVALGFVLATEVLQQTRFGGVRIGVPALGIVGLTLVAASALCIYFAVKPEHDPLELSESGRMKYVYVAEVLLALLFMHIRLTMPWLFTGFFEQYWPLVIVFLAFLGVGLSEALRRQGVLVVARPLERTGAFLPLLPVIGFWIIQSHVDYSLLLFMIGLLYATLSILRSSFMFGVLAALAGNGGLLYMLHQTESYGFLQHPQMWLIPVALSILVAAYLNRERLTEDQLSGVRYVTLMMIYVSSTADIFINGVAKSPWLPLALAGLSLAGVFAGIMLRVRAFLYLGATFLLIAVITMIRYAS
ncbi:MAG: hypothetical protein JO360_11055, partial [Acidobacteria bacterium]|nr:hypothetical protein [Acidobacteriota bacterium]